MRYRYISDCHLHSGFSPDGGDSMAMLCERAAALGLHAVAITDHCECNEYDSAGYRESARASYLESKRACVQFQGRLQVYAGIELGQATQNLAAAQDILDACDFDFVLASLHNLAGRPDFWELDYRDEDPQALLEQYFDQVQELVEWGNFDSLAHLTYPLRYMVGEHRLDFSIESLYGRIDTILRTLVMQDKALEVNTSGLRQKYGRTMPTLKVLRRFRELGGRFVTLGSDAHRWADVGAGIESGLSLLREAGFHTFTIFVKREPKQFPIE